MENVTHHIETDSSESKESVEAIIKSAQLYSDLDNQVEQAKENLKVGVW